MILATSLTGLGFDLRRSRHGPDFGFELDGQVYWIEATAPGHGNNPDRVPENPADGQVRDVPRREVMLRITSSLRTKGRRYEEYIRDRIVAEESATIVAISTGSIRQARFYEHRFPLAVEALYPIGNEYLAIDRNTMAVVDRGIAFRNEILRAGADPIEAPFLTDDYRHISGVIFWSGGLGTPLDTILGDACFIHNPRAAVTVPRSLFRRMKEYWLTQHAESVEVGWSSPEENQSLC